VRVGAGVWVEAGEGRIHRGRGAGFIEVVARSGG
jgi:hypothetical protein